MRKLFALSMVMAMGFLLAAGNSGTGNLFAAAQYQQYPDDAYVAYSVDQLDNLVAPIALYPDPLLAQVLIASTFPDQIQDASAWETRYGVNDAGIDEQPWDVSVKAVAHYPTVLTMMNSDIDWTATLGQAYVSQPMDTMSSVQRLRAEARAQGNLISTPQQQVIYQGGYIQIVPAQPQYIFVPTYDPGVIYTRRVYSGTGFGTYFSFGSGFAIGAWLNYDLDWGSRRVVYDGWHGGGWRQRSLPYVHVNNVYVNNRYQNVVVNRTVVNRQVNYQNVNRFNSVHRDVRFDNRARANNNPQNRPNPNIEAKPVQPPQPNRPNDNFNRGGAQNQTPPQGQRPNQPPAAQPQHNNDNFTRGRVQEQPQQAAPQPAPQVQRQNQPPAAQPQRPSENMNRGRVQEQPQRQTTEPAPQVQRQNQPPARVEQPKPAAPVTQPQAAPQERRQNQPPARVEQPRPTAPTAQPHADSHPAPQVERKNQPPAQVQQPKPAAPQQHAAPAPRPQQHENQPQSREQHNNNDDKDGHGH